MPESQTHRWSRAADVAVVAAVVLGGLYFLREVLIPLVLAVLLAFLLAPGVRGVQRIGLGRLPAVFLVVVLTLGLFGVGVWFVGAQALEIGKRLPDYQHSVSHKVRALRESVNQTILAGHPDDQRYTDRNVTAQFCAGGETLADAQRIPVATTQPAETGAAALSPIDVAPPGEPAVVAGEPPPEDLEVLRVLRGLLAPVLHPFAILGLTGILAIFFLAYREDLRDRMIRICGDAHIGLTTNMLSDAGARFSRYFVGLVAVNAATGAAIALGLLALGVPNAVLFGILTALLRFIPFLGPWLSAIFPIALSVAVFDGWAIPFSIVVLFLMVELVGANLLEPWVYGARVGASATAILLSTIFWTWMWGAVGLLLATPITVCLVVLGKYVPQLHWLYVLLGNGPVLQPHARFYQRLMALEPDDAIRVFRETSGSDPPPQTFSEVVAPALSLLAAELPDTETDARHEKTAREVIERLLKELEAPADATSADGAEPAPDVSLIDAPAAILLPVLGRYDELCAEMLARLFEFRGGAARVPSSHLLLSEVLDSLGDGPSQALCLLTVHRRNTRRIELLCRRIRDARPEAAIFVGVWDPAVDQRRLHQRLASCPRVHLCPTPAAALDELDAHRRRMSGTGSAADSPEKRATTVAVS